MGIIASMLYWQYNFSSTLAKNVAQKEFASLSSRLQENIKNSDQALFNYLDILSSFLKNSTLDEIFQNKFEYIKIFTAFLQKNENLYSIHIGNEKNQFFQIIKLDTNEHIASTLKHNKNDTWLYVETNQDTTIKQMAYFDKNLNVTSSQTKPNEFIVASRPWYDKAILSNKKSIKTIPYKYTSAKKRGITYAKNYTHHAVLGIDILSNSLEEILKQKHSDSPIDSFLLDKNLNLIASSSPSASKKYQKTICDINYLKSISISETKKIQSQTHFYRLSKIADEYLLSCVNIEEARKSFFKEFKGMALLTGAVAAFLLPLIWYLASIIIKPILLLSKENKKIENFQFDNVNKIDSKISEISRLSKSFASMAKSIQENKATLEAKVKKRTKELEKLSLTDRATNLANRVKIDSTIQEELDRDSRYGHGFGVIFMDIDYFKQVNDIYGHQVGDLVIEEFATIIKENSRKSDTAGRWGGEEFIIICPETNEANLIKIAQKLQNAICDHSFSKVGRKTASFGLTLSKKDDTLIDIMHRVDKALYQAKSNGRNRIEVVL